jgi:integrase
MLLIDSTTGPLCLPMFLELSAATGARRGEVLALRWCDIEGDNVVIARSLSQTRLTLEFKGTKTDRPRPVGLPQSVRSRLEAYRKQQDKYRQQFGPDYRADLDLIFANPNGSPLKPNSVSASVSLLCRRLGLPKGANLDTLRHSLQERATRFQRRLPNTRQSAPHLRASCVGISTLRGGRRRLRPMGTSTIR